METTPRTILRRRSRWLAVIWIVCAFLTEIVYHLRWHFPKLKEWPMIGLAIVFFAGVVRLMANLMSCPVCGQRLPREATELQDCPHCGAAYDQPMPQRPIS